jgi:hypothetical protein
MTRITQFLSKFVLAITVVVFAACGDSPMAPVIEEEVPLPDFFVSMDTTTYVLPPISVGNTWGLGMRVVVTGTGIPDDKIGPFAISFDNSKLVRVSGRQWYSSSGWSYDSNAPTLTIDESIQVQSVGEAGVVTMKVWHLLDPKKVATYVMTFQK